MLFELENITLCYQRFEAVKKFTVKVRKGAVGLLGPNGAGKTTLVKGILGLKAPASGNGKVLGRDIFCDQLAIRKRVGYMPERDAYIDRMNAVAYVAYAGMLAGMARTDAKQRAHEVLHYVGLGEARYRELKTYSVGMRQRVKLAQAIVHDPELIILDEPTNGLDPRGRDDVLDFIRDITTEYGINLLLSSHLLPDVERVCSEVIVMRSGELRAYGNIEEMKKSVSRSFEVRVKGDGDCFQQKLQSTRGVSVEPWENGVIVSLPDGMDTDCIFRAAHDSEVQVRHLVSRKRSLQDVFVEALEE